MTELALHENEPQMSEQLVRRLLASQFPAWSSLPIRLSKGSGTTHWVYRLGDEMCIRLPRVAYGDAAIERAVSILPHFANLSIEVPEVLGVGQPELGYPFGWCVSSWIEGDVFGVDLCERADSKTLARDVAKFLKELRHIPRGDFAPIASRAQPLIDRDAEVRRAIDVLEHRIDADLARDVWSKGLEAPVCEDAALRWVHADLLPGNLVLREGKLAGVLDFDGAGVGDPACDLLVAWSCLDAPGRGVLREVFEENLASSEAKAAWARGRAHALAQAVKFIPYYQHRVGAEVGVKVAWRQLREVLGSATLLDDDIT